MKKKSNPKDAKRNLITVVITMLVILVAVAGSYAYFIVSVDNTDSASVTVEAKTLGVHFDNGSSFEFNDILPGAKFIKTFTISNTGSKEMVLDIKVIDVINELVNKDELVCELAYKDESIVGVFPSRDSYIAGNIVIAPDEEITFTLTMEYLNTSSSQNVDMNKTIAGTINITNVTETGN